MDRSIVVFSFFLLACIYVGLYLFIATTRYGILCSLKGSLSITGCTVETAYTVSLFFFSLNLGSLKNGKRLVPFFYFHIQCKKCKNFGIAPVFSQMRTVAKWPRAEGLWACEKKRFEVAFVAIQ